MIPNCLSKSSYSLIKQQHTRVSFCQGRSRRTKMPERLYFYSAPYFYTTTLTFCFCRSKGFLQHTKIFLNLPPSKCAKNSLTTDTCVNLLGNTPSLMTMVNGAISTGHKVIYDHFYAQNNAGQFIILDHVSPEVVKQGRNFKKMSALPKRSPKNITFV